jgi:peroxiredoxin (alkyl hydroperoxide reductase subunit C)
MGVSVGKEAPAFRAEAYHQGLDIEIRLRDYRGRWVVIFFYPADFTCV